jgi:rhamnose utilization protein RhaD (predicted bifunctional aldolase and dehydrogenase)
MFNVNYFIDTVQMSKKMFVDSFITDPSVKSTLHAFVDAQTVFVKQIHKTGETFTQYFKKV